MNLLLFLYLITSGTNEFWTQICVSFLNSLSFADNACLLCAVGYQMEEIRGRVAELYILGAIKPPPNLLFFKKSSNKRITSFYDWYVLVRK